MSFNTRQYFRSWGLYVRGVRWLWTRGYSAEAAEKVRRVQPFYTFAEDIVFKPGYGPWRFLPIYLSTYLIGTLAGFGVVSISKVLWERSEVMSWGGIRHQFEEQCLTRKPPCRFAYPLSCFLCRLIDWLFLKLLRQENHCAGAGPRLWGSRSAWE